MARLKITSELIEKIIGERVKRFESLCTSQKLINFIKDIQIIIYLDNRIVNFYGYADKVCKTDKKEKKHYKINRNNKSTEFEDDQCYFILGICTKPFGLIKDNRNLRYELTDTVAHELAHILEFYINGYDDRSIHIFHTKTWKRFAKLFGCRNVKAILER
jgi:hypothetical protein